MMQHFFETAPQNPYIFAALVLLAIVSAWQPVARIIVAVRNFYRNVVHAGLTRTIVGLREYTDREAEQISSDPAFGAMELLLNFRWSMQIILNAIILFLIGLAVWTLPDDLGAPLSPDGRKLIGAIIFLVASLSALVWIVDGLLQTTIAGKVRKKLRARA